MATMCGIIMPLLYPDLTFQEEGFYLQDGILVSPDGSLRSDDNSVKFAFEGKAPTEKTFTTSLHYKVPDRYITQTLFEQKVLNAEGTLYMSWTDQTCTLFKVRKHSFICYMKYCKKSHLKRLVYMFKCLRTVLSVNIYKSLLLCSLTP